MAKHSRRWAKEEQVAGLVPHLSHWMREVDSSFGKGCGDKVSVLN